MTPTAQLAALRKLTQRLEREVFALEGQVALLEKTPAREDELAAAQARLDAKAAELASAQDELEGLEGDRQAEREGTDELEQLVDSFGATIARVPELARVLEAMKLSVGALATAKRLGRSNEALVEPPQIAAALTEALTLLATFVSTPAGHVRLPDELTGVARSDRREHFPDIAVQHRGRRGVATVDVLFEGKP